MKILSDYEIKEKKEQVLPEILDQIFLICKEDDNFKVGEKLNEYDSKIDSCNNKLSKKKQLLEQSKEIEKKLLKELEKLDEGIFNKRSNLLESLGSDL